MAKKIGAILSLIIIGAVIIAAIVMANIDIDYSVKCVKPDVIYVQTSTDTIKVSNNQRDKIVELISGASKENVLTALFNGELGKKAEIVTSKATLTTPNNFYVRYKYTTKQDLVVDGKIYKNADGKTETYEELVFVVNPFDEEAEFKVYVIPESDSANVYSYYYNLSANFKDLYDYLSENFDN